MARPRVFFDISANGSPLGRVIIEVTLRAIFLISLQGKTVFFHALEREFAGAFVITH